jgi:hypothetical protein
MRTQEAIHRRSIPDVGRDSSELNIKQKWQNTCMGTSQTIPTLAQQAKTEPGRADWLLQPNQTINQGHVREDQQVA